MCPANDQPAAAPVPRSGAGVYRICVAGRLAADWQPWFDGLTLSVAAPGETQLTGRVADQAALHGMLAKIRDLGLVLVSLERISDGT